MLLSTIFESLTYGELKQLAIGGSEEGGIHPLHTDEILSHLNLGMLSLYEKFPLQERELHLKTQEGITTYSLTSANALSQDNAGYIQDTVEDPFLDDILRIDGVFNSLGQALEVNDNANPYAVFLPSYNTIQIPQNLEEGADFYLIYRARPLSIALVGEATPETTEVPLPSILLAPLLTYISARAYTAKAGESGKQEGAFNMQQYEQMCRNLEMRNVFNNSLTNSNCKKEINGWA